MTKQQLTGARLRELLSYDADTGIFIWRAKPNKRMQAGDVAGTSDGRYRQIRVDGVIYRSHRLAWLYVHGEFPANEIDHINGDKLDNRILNLRDVTRSVNQQNVRRAYSTNKSGVLGVSEVPTVGSRIRYVAKLGGKYLGGFDNPQDAHLAYVFEKRKHHQGTTL